MANTYKNIVITPNIGSNTADPKVVYSGGNTTANTDITLYVYPDSNGSLSWEGSAGQLFSITNDLSNNIFGVNDVSGIPYIEVYANGFVSVAPFGGNVTIGNTAEFILSPGTGLWANGSVGTAGQALSSNGSSVYWTTITSGATLNANNTETGTFYFGMANTTSGTWTNAVVSTTKLSFIPNTGLLTVNGSINATTISTGSVNVINASGLTTTANVSIGAAGDLVLTAGAGISANGGLGTSGQVLTSNASSVYWSTVSTVPVVNSSASFTSPLAWTSTGFDMYAATALANALTINADAGSPSNGKRMLFRFKDNGTARALTWTTGSTNSFRAIGTTLPTTTVISKTLYVGCVYNAADSRWDVIAIAQEA